MLGYRWVIGLGQPQCGEKVALGNKCSGNNHRGAASKRKSVKVYNKLRVQL